jgi:molecular chaperone DnaK (HSP70)
MSAKMVRIDAVAESRTAEFDPLIDRAPSRYVVGIDLGTTNSAVMYVDTEETPWHVRLLSLPQLVAPGQVEARDTLPSFHYQAAPGEMAHGAMRLPWHKDELAWAVGVMARDEGTKSPGRLIASAKSWLCHSGVDRHADLLPWQGAVDVERLSPVDASARFLGHIRDSWNAQFPNQPLAEQDIVITLPASFDEVARELTVEAAASAKLPRVVLIEEPQAAFYAWVYKHQDDWQQQVDAGHTILVCDIGGGTSDYTLIKARRSESDAVDVDGNIQFHRIAVGDHLILGGDNLDLALAHEIERKLADRTKLTPKQWDVLVRSCRRAKETLLGQGAPEQATVNLPGAGAKLIGGSLQIAVTRAEVVQLLVDGFLPHVDLAERPTPGQSGFREFGLPYASDPAMTRHLAAFLNDHGEVALDDSSQTSGAARPEIVLFNGGFFASPLLRERLLKVLSDWFSQPGDSWQPRVLDNDRLDLAVARGAAYYGMVRRGEGVRIAASLARSYYIGVESNEVGKAVCLVPGNAEPGEHIDLANQRFDLTISEPVEFAIYVSSTRLTDRPGEILEVDPEQMKSLPPIRTVLRTQRRSDRGTVPVTLHAHLSEIGTVDLWCQAVETDHRWKLQFDIRSATQTDIAAHKATAEAEGFVDEQMWQTCEAAISEVFSADGQQKPSALIKRLSAALGCPRQEWPSSLLRRIWETLIRMESGRRRSQAHESRWLNLLGYALRPGYGLAVDDWRVAETWRTVRGKLAHGGVSSQAESLILWRRIAGGLSKGQQLALADPLVSSVRAQHAISMVGKRSRGRPAIAIHEASEAWRLIGAMELLGVPVKVELGNMIVDLLPKRKFEKVRNPMVWALGRLGQRVPLYGPLNTVVPTKDSATWLESLLQVEGSDSQAQLAVMELARRTHDRHRDLPETLRAGVTAWLQQCDAPLHLVELVRDGGSLANEEQDQVFGEALPKGLRLRS